MPGNPAILPGKASNLHELIQELKPILDVQQLPKRAFHWIFDGEQLLTKPHPNCGGQQCADTQLLPKNCQRVHAFLAAEILSSGCVICAGTWMEFGVFQGDTINAAADYRKNYCEKNPPPIYGFDTFQGLPEAWGNHMEQV